jgi:hypothetical protein
MMEPQFLKIGKIYISIDDIARVAPGVTRDWVWIIVLKTPDSGDVDYTQNGAVVVNQSKSIVVEDTDDINRLLSFLERRTYA